jgi:hypothetical protein
MLAVGKLNSPFPPNPRHLLSKIQSELELCRFEIKTTLGGIDTLVTPFHREETESEGIQMNCLIANGPHVCLLSKVQALTHPLSSLNKNNS